LRAAQHTTFALQTRDC